MERLVDEIKIIRKKEPTANILIYTEYVDSLREIERRVKAAKLGPTLTIHGAARDSDLDHEKIDRQAVTHRFRSENNLILISTDAAVVALFANDPAYTLLYRVAYTSATAQGWVISACRTPSSALNGTSE